MSVKVEMPNGGDESIKVGTILALRDPLSFEREETPEVRACLWGVGYRIYPAEPIDVLVKKFEDDDSEKKKLHFVRLTAPDGSPLLVNGLRVLDRDDRSAIVDHEATRSVLVFGTGATAPRIRVRETKSDLETIWSKEGLDMSDLD